MCTTSLIWNAAAFRPSSSPPSNSSTGAQVQGKALGFDPAAVWVEHPIQDRTDDEMVAIADKAFDELIEQLVAA